MMPDYVNKAKLTRWQGIAIIVSILGLSTACGLGGAGSYSPPPPPLRALPPLRLSLHSLDFHSIVVGEASPPQQIIVTNVSDHTIRIVAFDSSGTDSFNTQNNCGELLQPDATCVLTIQFRPRMSGALSNTLVLHLQAADTQSIFMRGQGVAKTAAPPPHP